MCQRSFLTDEKVGVLSVLQLFNGNIIQIVRCAYTGSFTVLEQWACYIMMPLHAAVISLYNHHRSVACRETKHQVQDRCNTDVFHNKSASAFFHTPFVTVWFLWLRICIF